MDVRERDVDGNGLNQGLTQITISYLPDRLLTEYKGGIYLKVVYDNSSPKAEVKMVSCSSVNECKVKHLCISVPGYLHGGYQ